MKKKTVVKATKKKVAKKVAKKKITKKKVVRKTPKQNVGITVRVQQEPTALAKVGHGVIEPLKPAGKYSLPATWISEKQVMIMLQNTPKEQVFTRPGKGGQQWSYVTGHYVEKVLNYVFGWNWDMEIVSKDIYGLEAGIGQVVVHGKLTVKDSKGHEVTKSQFGRADIKYKRNTKNPLDIGNDFKAATTDALKKCASLLGIASDIYGKQEFNDHGVVIKKDTNPPKPYVMQATCYKKGEEPVEEPVIVNTKVKPSQASVIECYECAEPISKAEADYSKRLFKKQLCRSCQSIIKNNI